jgi:hypothetical protein
MAIGGHMEPHQYLYTFNYPLHEKELCNLEIRALFNLEAEEKVIISEVEVDPSISPYLKTRLKMTLESGTYEGIHQMVLEANIIDSQFLVKYTRTGLMDPPYGNFTSTSDEERLMILRKGKEICDQLVVVSQIDIKDLLVSEELKIVDSCLVGKPRKSDFYRYVYVCLTDTA